MLRVSSKSFSVWCSCKSSFEQKGQSFVSSISKYFHTSQSVHVTSYKPHRIEDYDHDSLPSDKDWIAPEKYQYLWLDREDSVTLVPDGWHAVEGCWEEPWKTILGQPAYTYGIGKEDVIERSFFDTGVTITGWRNVFPSKIRPNCSAIEFGKELAHKELGEEMVQFIADTGKKGIVDGDECQKLFDRRPVGNRPIVQGIQISKDTLAISIAMYKYNEGSTGTFDIPPMDIYFAVDYLMYNKNGRVIKTIYECPMENMNEDRPILDTIRELSIWNYSLERSQFRKGTLEVARHPADAIMDDQPQSN